VSAPTANQIKTQLKTLLTPVIGTSNTKKVKIFDYLALAFKSEEGTEVAILRSSMDDAMIQGTSTMIKRVNCLMISEASLGQAKVPVKEDSTRLITTPRGKNIVSRHFRLTYFYQFGDSSENTFSTNIELIRTTLNANQKLGFAVPGVGEWVEGHDELQMPAMDPDNFGTTVVHVGFGLLTVRLIEALG
jgi:hypothetical protein